MSDDSDDDLDALRHDLVVARGLDPAAVQFIGGATVAEIEASVDGFAKLVASHGDDHEREQPDSFRVVARDRRHCRSRRA